MILDRSPVDEPLIPAERTKIRLEMMRKKKKAELNDGESSKNKPLAGNRNILKDNLEKQCSRKQSPKKQNGEKSLEGDPCDIFSGVKVWEKREHFLKKNLRRNEVKSLVDPTEINNRETQNTISTVEARVLAEPLPGCAICNKGSISLPMKETDQKIDNHLNATSEVFDEIISYSFEKEGDEAKVMMIEGDATNTIISKSAPQLSNFLSTRKQASNTPKPAVCKDHEGASTATEIVFINSQLASNRQNIKNYMENGEVKNSIITPY